MRIFLKICENLVSDTFDHLMKSGRMYQTYVGSNENLISDTFDHQTPVKADENLVKIYENLWRFYENR